MPPLTHLLLLSLLAPLAPAFQLPFRLPFASSLFASSAPAQAPVTLPDPAAPPSNRIAIIGAGAGGSAAAFWLGKARERHGLDVQVDVFERSGYVGGRSTTVHPYNDPTLTPIELGASIFVRANKNLWRATDEFGLARIDFADSEDGDGGGTMGIWDGAEFRLMTGYSKVGGWWDTLKVLWRYGFRAPSRTKALVQTMLTQFLTLYAPGPSNAPYASIAALVARFNWTDATNMTAAEYFAARGVDRRWTMEMVEAATRVNYGQNADAIHALEALCSLAADNASQVKGGNWQIFAEFLARSNASLHLNTTVTAVRQLPDGQFAVRTRARSPNSGSSSPDTEPEKEIETEQTYRAIILAAPYHTASIPIHLASASASGPAPDVPAVPAAPDVPEQPYVRLHVTLLSTPAPHAKARYFKLKEGAEVPRMVLTTWEGVRAGEDQGQAQDAGEGEGLDEGQGEGDGDGESEEQTQSARAPEFNSLTYHGKLTRLNGTPANITRRRADGGDDGGEGREEWIVKIFSDKKIEDRWLRRVFGEVGWVHRKEWDAYPVLPPTTSFPPIELAKGLYYVNAFEPLISTMETETLSARNAVELLLRDEFNAGLCASGPGDDVPEDFVYGWDCL